MDWRQFQPHWGTRALLAISVGLLAISAIFDLTPISGAGAIVVFAGFVFLLVHGSVTLGPRNTVAFIVITVALSFAAEAVGVATGIVFGEYHYSDELGPKILGVPPLVQVAYVAMGYASLMTARAILGGSASAQRHSLPVLALAGALVMVGWDVAMDPGMSTISGDWIWEEGGSYFGVPLHNYAGWFATVFAFMLCYELWERRSPPRAHRDLGDSRLFRSEPVVYYAIIGLGIVATPVLGAGPEQLASPENYGGSVEEINDSMALVACFVMGAPVTFALSRIWSRP